MYPCTGITTVCDMGIIGDSWQTFETLEDIYIPLAKKRQLSLRIFAMLPLPLLFPYAASQPQVYYKLYEVGVMAS